MDCPHCGQELDWHDWYGTNMKFDGSGNKKGDIFRCGNDKCNAYEEHFYTRGDDDEIIEGFPC